MTYLKERHLFPGGNSHKGFYSFYKYILSQEDANRILCLKGGPGTGKSSLMKKLGDHFKTKGYTIEYHHCSSDNNSLDAVVIKELKVAILDGTSPHMVDPIHPGAVDEVINMGDALDMDILATNKKEIIELTKIIGSNFKRAYSFLNAAKSIHEDWSNLNAEAIDICKMSTVLESLKDAIFTKHKSGYGNERHLFCTAFTPNGIVTFSKELVSEFETKHVLKGGPGFCKTEILMEICKIAQKKGYLVEYMHDPFIPERLEHIFIPELSTCVVTENEINQLSFDGNIYDLEKFCNADILAKNQADVAYNSKLFYDLTSKATSFITKAHELHDNLEVYYIKAMNFDVADKIYTEIINKFKKYE